LELLQQEAGNGQKNRDPKKLESEKAEFEEAVRTLLQTLPRHKIKRPQIAEEYDRRRKTLEPLDPSTITYIVKRCYPKGTTVEDAVALVVAKA
jgi:hypothetical protein